MYFSHLIDEFFIYFFILARQSLQKSDKKYTDVAD